MHDMNKNSKYYLTLLAAILLTGCSSDSFLGIDEEPVDPINEVAIDFGSTARAITRADAETSAALLNNHFTVFGTKTSANGSTSDIFDNYQVEYQKELTGKTDTNEKGWEYVGLTSKNGAAQNTKFWDFSAKQYDFVAAAGLAPSEKFTNTTDGIRINVPDAAAMTSIYVSDRVTATHSAKAATATTPATMAYANTVELKFRRLGAQMRIGFYETIPGYAVKDLIFYYVGAPSGSKNAGVGCAFPVSGKYTVSYNDANNEAITQFSGANNEVAFSNQFGQLNYVAATSLAGIAGKEYIDADGTPVADPVNRFIGTSSAQATFARGTYTIDAIPGVLSDYKPILPYENNSLKMQMRLDYTLVALDGSKEEIHVNDAYVYIPVNYVQWKPNHTYTYIFKITDKSNGYTGEGGGGKQSEIGNGRDPDPDHGGGDNDPSDYDGDGIIDPPYIQVVPTIPDPDAPLIPDPDNPGSLIPDPDAPQIPDPNYPPTIPDPDDPTKEIPNPDLPWVPNPVYPVGPEGDQGDPSNPVPTPQVPDDPDDPDSPTHDDPDNPAGLYPITFDAIVVEETDGTEIIYTNIDGTINSSHTEH